MPLAHDYRPRARQLKTSSDMTAWLTPVLESIDSRLADMERRTRLIAHYQRRGRTIQEIAISLAVQADEVGAELLQ